MDVFAVLPELINISRLEKTSTTFGIGSKRAFTVDRHSLYSTHNLTHFMTLDQAADDDAYAATPEPDPDDDDDDEDEDEDLDEDNYDDDGYF